jgi:hypothetical protein
MPHEIFFGIPGNKFGAGIILEKHDGEYQLVSAQKSQTGGTIWKRWGFPETKNATPLGAFRKLRTQRPKI